MAEAAHPVLSKQRVHGGETSTYKDRGVGYFVAPLYAKDLAKAVQVKAVQPSFSVYVVHVLLPYSRVLTMQTLYTAIMVEVDSLLFPQTRVVSRPRVVAVLPMCLLILASRDRLSLMVDPRYVNWWTTSSMWLSMIMTGGVFMS